MNLIFQFSNNNKIKTEKIAKQGAKVLFFVTGSWVPFLVMETTYYASITCFTTKYFHHICSIGVFVEKLLYKWTLQLVLFAPHTMLMTQYIKRVTKLFTFTSCAVIWELFLVLSNFWKISVNPTIWSYQPTRNLFYPQNTWMHPIFTSL